jgi:hypothetical protein
MSASMAMVALPPLLGDTPVHSEFLRLYLREVEGIVIQKCVAVQGDRLYFRVSAAVYNTVQEAVLLRDAVLRYCKLVEEGLCAEQYNAYL